MKTRLKTRPKTCLKNRSIATLAMVLLPLAAQAKTDSLRLDPVPLAASVDCDRVFFSSAQRQLGTVYVMPRVVIGQTQEFDVFQLEPDGAGGYVFSVGVYFPRDDERMKPKLKTNHAIPSSCNFEQVQYVLNKTAKPKVQTIARMPLTSIEISMPGLSQTALIGKLAQSTEQPDILNYYGVGYTVEFRLTEAEKNTLLRRMARPQGLPFDVTFKFQARSFDGSVTAQIDWKSLAAGVRAAAAGKPKLIAKVELETMIETALKSSKASLSFEEGRSASYAKMADKIVDLILAAKDGETAKSLELKKSEGVADLIRVDAALSFIAKQSTRQISFEQYSAPEMATAATTVSLESRPFDPNVREIELVSGEQDPTLDEPLVAGQSIKISAAYSYKSRLEIKEKKTYLTAGQLEDLQLMQRLPDLATGHMRVANQELNGKLLAVGAWNVLAPTSVVPIYHPSRYVWQRTERYAERKDGATERFSAKLEDLKKWPIFVTFSGLGRRLYHLTELIGDHESWTGEFNESGSIVLKAKVDLGLITLRENFLEGQDFKVENVNMDEVVQIERTILGAEKISAPTVLREETRKKIETTTAVLYISRPSK